MQELRKITLRRKEGFGRGLAPEIAAPLFAELRSLARRSLRMRFEGRSTAVGKYPSWLSRASEMQFVDQSNDGFDGKILFFECASLDEAIPLASRERAMVGAKPNGTDTGSCWTPEPVCPFKNEYQLLYPES
jgi:hypothetical protein